MTIKPTKNYHNHLTRIATFCALLYCNSAFCAELVEYDHTFLMGQNASNIDLSRYSEGNPAIPGMYDVSVYVNDQPIINQSITFIEIEGKKNAQACITLKNLLQFHINSPDINNEKAVLLARDETLGNCLNLTEIIPQASVRYDVNEQRLDIDVPQAWVMKITKTMLIHRYGKMALMRPCCHTTSTDIIVKLLVEEMTAFMLLLTVG